MADANVKHLDITDMRVKTEQSRQRGVSAFIRDTLNEIPQGKALALTDLATMVHEKFDIDKQQSYVRVNNVLRGRIGEKFGRFEKDGYTYVGPVTSESKPAGTGRRVRSERPQTASSAS